MTSRLIACMLICTGLNACASTSLNSALGTPKNPTVVLAQPYPADAKPKYPADQYTFIAADYRVLLTAIDTHGVTRSGPITPGEMRHYLGSGYHLADVYCARYFAKTDEAYRRRRYGRTLTNDVGTAVTTIVGLAKAGESVVTALAAATGVADSAWRNYDDSFVISPDLANVRALVLAAQDNFRARTLDKDSTLPSDFGTAQSTIERYAGLCSYLGMKSLLDQSASKEQASLTTQTDKIVTPVGAVGLGGAPVVGIPAAPATDRPATAIPALATNKSN